MVCRFSINTTAVGCELQLQNSIMTLSGRFNSDVNVAEGCISNIITGYYDLYVYDVENDNTLSLLPVIIKNHKRVNNSRVDNNRVNNNNKVKNNMVSNNNSVNKYNNFIFDINIIIINYCKNTKIINSTSFIFYIISKLVITIINCCRCVTFDNLHFFVLIQLLFI